jgi:hypothetical protein
MSDYRPSPRKPRLLITRCKGSVTRENDLVDLEITVLKGWLRVRGTAAGPLFISRNHRAIGRMQVFRLQRDGVGIEF